VAENNYPTGIYAPEDPLLPNNDDNPGDDPSWITGPVLDMSEAWQPVDCCVGGTQYFRRYASTFLPQEPKEDNDAWERRVSHATLSPYTVRIAEQAAGLILRKPIQLSSKTDNGTVDPYWEDFAKDVDGFGTDIDSFARRLAINSVLYGHSSVLVDYPSTEAASNLAEERALGLRPYLINVDAKNILGWRKDQSSPIAPITQIRINELVSEPLGAFGDHIVRQIRVLEPGSWKVYRQLDDEWYIHQEGETTLGKIPLTVTYSSKEGELISKPPLLPIANLNIAHGQRTADLSHSLHVAALPILVLQGFDDTDNEIGLSANSAILLPPEGKASFCEPASSAFAAQQGFITELESQMSNLGISTLFAQKMAAETAESKAISRSDSDSLLSVVSKDLQACLQEAFDLAAEFIGAEAPLVSLDRDFDLAQLDGSQVQQYIQLWTNGAITQETLLEQLKKGEILPSVDVETEIEMTGQESLNTMLSIPSEEEEMEDLPNPAETEETTN
tara:strand:+ start:932 stop:2440 length:1509 start_codon:yes stop_codon:yes gene_type:complete